MLADSNTEAPTRRGSRKLLSLTATVQVKRQQPVVTRGDSTRRRRGRQAVPASGVRPPPFGTDDNLSGESHRYSTDSISEIEPPDMGFENSAMYTTSMLESGITVGVDSSFGAYGRFGYQDAYLAQNESSTWNDTTNGGPGYVVGDYGKARTILRRTSFRSCFACICLECLACNPWYWLPRAS